MGLQFLYHQTSLNSQGFPITILSNFIVTKLALKGKQSIIILSLASKLFEHLKGWNSPNGFTQYDQNVYIG
jgi:hypothetical protein